jgi:hypothetical protein
MRRLDITGQRFGELVAIRIIGKTTDGRLLWECQCDCGTVKSIPGTNLRKGITTSCGCRLRWIQDSIGDRSLRHGAAKRGKTTPEYRTWMHMRGRCGDQHDKEYHNYGGRGISVCERWNSFKIFLADMGPRPVGKYSIERLDVNGNYEPANCIWLPMNQQAKNRRRQHQH